MHVYESRGRGRYRNSAITAKLLKEARILFALNTILCAISEYQDDELNLLELCVELSGLAGEVVVVRHARLEWRDGN